MTLTIVADATEGPMSVWSGAIAQGAHELRRGCTQLEAELLGIAAREAPVAGDLRLVIVLIEVVRHIELIANQFELPSDQLAAIGAPGSTGRVRLLVRAGGGLFRSRGYHPNVAW
jgi:hypothetical protein